MLTAIPKSAGACVTLFRKVPTRKTPNIGPFINDGVWHNIALTFDRSAALARSYVDGALIDTRSISSLGSLVVGQPLTIGQDPTGSYGVSGTFDLDDVGIWRRALDGYEVQSIYGAAQTSGQSFDVYGPVVLHMERSGSDLIIAWQAGTLFQADTPSGPWTLVPGATAPSVKITPGANRKFYRVNL